MKSFISKFITLLFFFAVGYCVIHFVNNRDISAYAQTTPSPSPSTDWYMSGANPERTSWVSAEVRNSLGPAWYRPIEPYVAPHIQVVLSADVAYVSTAKGLYAFNVSDGSVRWVFPTELPLGNSPTIVNNVAYVGGFDHKLYAINVNVNPETLPLDQQTDLRVYDLPPLWTFDGGNGFDTNPLVVNGVVYLGNRDGYFYAINASNGSLAWKFKTDGPIRFSAAFKNNIIYFGSDDSFAYALTTSGTRVWKTKLIYSMGFHNYWPMIYPNPQTGRDTVIFVGSANYRTLAGPGPGSDLENLDADDFLYPAYGDQGEIGPRDAQGRIDISDSVRYWEQRPYRRTVYILDAATGSELTFNINGNETLDYAPIFWDGTRSGMRYPPILGGDGLLYIANLFTVTESRWQARGHVAGWYMGTGLFKTPAGIGQSVDEPLSYAAGGNVVYWNLIDDRNTGAFDVNSATNWEYVSYNGYYAAVVPDYDKMTWGTYMDNLTKVYGNSALGSGWAGQPAGRNGIYGYNGPLNPPIPHIAGNGVGRVFTVKGNAIIAFVAGGNTRQPLSTAGVVADPKVPSPVSVSDITAQLSNEVAKMVPGPHLRPGYTVAGAFDRLAYSGQPGTFADNWLDIYASSWETFLALSRAYQYLPSQQSAIRTYLQTEYNQYPPCTYSHNGWQGASRDGLGTGQPGFELADDIESAFTSGPRTDSGLYGGYSFPPQVYYALWKYAQTGGRTASQILSDCGPISTPPGLSTLTQFPEAHNAWIMGYQGYVNLQNMAGQNSTTAQNTLNSLLSSRASNLTNTVNSPWQPTQDSGTEMAQNLAAARNFLFLTKETGQYLNQYPYNPGRTAKDVYALFSSLAPYWMSPKFQAGYGENGEAIVINYPALFAGKAWIMTASREDLARYVDGPAFIRGDLYRINNLVTVLETPPSQPAPTPTPGVSPTPSPTPLLGDINQDHTVNAADLRLILTNFIGSTVCQTFNCDVSGDGKVNLLDAAYVIRYFGQTW